MHASNTLINQPVLSSTISLKALLGTATNSEDLFSDCQENLRKFLLSYRKYGKSTQWLFIPFVLPLMRGEERYTGSSVASYLLHNNSACSSAGVLLWLSIKFFNAFPFNVACRMLRPRRFPFISHFRLSLVCLVNPSCSLAVLLAREHAARNSPISSFCE